MGDPGSGSTITAKLNRLARRRFRDGDPSWRTDILDQMKAGDGDDDAAIAAFESIVLSNLGGTVLAQTAVERGHLLDNTDFDDAMKLFILDTFQMILEENAPVSYEMEFGSKANDEKYDMKYNVNTAGEYTVTFRAPDPVVEEDAAVQPAGGGADVVQ